VKKAQESYLDAKGDYYRLKECVSNLEHKRSQLNNLVQLFIAGYYAKPSNSIQRKIRKGLNNEKKS
jgi:hypothetical protein